MKHFKRQESVVIFIALLIFGIYFLIVQKQTLTGLLIIGVGIGAHFLEVTKWIVDLIDIAKKLMNASNQKRTEVNQTQNDSPMSTQAVATEGGTVNISTVYNVEQAPKMAVKESVGNREKISELVEAVNSHLAENDFQEALMNCIRIASIKKLHKDALWLENELYGFDTNPTKSEKDYPNYRMITAEVRMADDSPLGYNPIDLPLYMGQPITQLQEWCNSALAGKQNAILINGPMTDRFRQAIIDALGRNPYKSEEVVPYIVKTSSLQNIISKLKLRVTRFVNALES